MKSAARMLLINGMGGDEWERRAEMPGGDDNRPGGGYGGVGRRRIGFNRAHWDPPYWGGDEGEPEYSARRMRATGSVWVDDPHMRRRGARRENPYAEMDDDDDDDDDDEKMKPMDQHKAQEWLAKMQNADGTTGAHWRAEQVEPLRTSICPECEKWDFVVAINMMYSDYCAELKKYGADKPEVYAGMAKAFLRDEDAKKDKLARYKKYIVK